MAYTIYHNPNCNTSRTVLGVLREAGIEPRVVEYLKTPPSRAELTRMLADMEMTPRQILRRNGSPFEELGLDNSDLSDDDILDAIDAHPILIQRPIVVSPLGTRLCRPSERVRELLPA